MAKPESIPNIVISVTAGYREEQIRPFLASLQYYAPGVSLRLIVGKPNPEFEDAVRAWFPDCSFHLLPPSALRDFGLKRKWARSILKRASRWSRSQALARKLLKINFLRHLVIRDLLKSWNLKEANLLLCDSRDLVFQGNPFAGEWPALWSCEEDKRLEECELNSFWFKRAGGKAALLKARNRQIVCAGVLGGQAAPLSRYLENSSGVVERLAPDISLDDGDQGIHNYLVREKVDLGFTILPNGCWLAANVGSTKPEEIVIHNGMLHLRDRTEAPAILHQFDRHPRLIELVNSRWGKAKPVRH